MRNDETTASGWKILSHGTHAQVEVKPYVGYNIRDSQEKFYSTP